MQILATILQVLLHIPLKLRQHCNGSNSLLLVHAPIGELGRRIRREIPVKAERVCMYANPCGQGLTGNVARMMVSQTLPGGKDLTFPDMKGPQGN